MESGTALIPKLPMPAAFTFPLFCYVTWGELSGGTTKLVQKSRHWQILFVKTLTCARIQNEVGNHCLHTDLPDILVDVIELTLSEGTAW